jgi:hypothetical protein
MASLAFPDCWLSLVTDFIYFFYEMSAEATDWIRDIFKEACTLTNKYQRPSRIAFLRPNYKRIFWTRSKNIWRKSFRPITYN